MQIIQSIKLAIARLAEITQGGDIHNQILLYSRYKSNFPEGVFEFRMHASVVKQIVEWLLHKKLYIAS